MYWAVLLAALLLIYGGAPAEAQAKAKPNYLYIKYVCQKCGYSIVLPKDHAPPNTKCREGGKHRWKRTPVKS
jgi:hypothetical protein